ncbi:MAG: ABC transporter permease subunit [Deltaproteobacteria bacterium]|nr:ABC transporter permease subunit [Deltaproteobacteria bacterium]
MIGPPHSHFSRARRRLGHAWRIRAGLLVLALVALPALFAELLAADAPIVAQTPQGWALLPAVGRAAPAGAGWDRARFAIWPVLRHGPNTASAAGPHAAATWEHPLGTDGAGRDVAARLIYGARGALGAAAAALLAALLLGVVAGALAGHFGGFWDELLARPVELCAAFPPVVVAAVVLVAWPGGSVGALALAVAAVRWAELARLVRAEVIRLGAADFVLGARAVGCSPWRLLARHVLPHAMGPVLVSLMFGMASTVLLEAALSFLGIGLDVSWGSLIAGGLAPSARPTPLLAAAAALAVTVGASYLVADALGENVDGRVATSGGRR